jgi:hypothetical protein
LKEIDYTRQLQSQLSKYSKGKKIKVSSLFFIFTKNKELMKTITSHRNLFINKTGFKHSDWKKIGLLHSNTYSNNISCLQPKYPKDDFTIVSNVLIKNYVQQYYNFEHLFKKSSHIFMVSRKPLNLSPFLISYRNLSNQPMSFNFHALMRSINAKPEIKAFKAMQLQNKGKKPFFKLSYSPISNFDYILYPSLSSQIINILNSYLIHSTIKNENKMDLLSPKQRFYSSFNNIIKNIFEAPCFMFSLTQSFDFSTLNKNKIVSNANANTNANTNVKQMQKTEFFYNNHTLPLLSQTLRNKRVREQVDAQTNYYSPFKGELVYTQNISPLSSTDGASNPFGVRREMAGHRGAYSSFTEIGWDNQQESLPIAPFSYSCMFLTKNNLISYYLPIINNNHNFKFRDYSNLRINKDYEIQDTFIKFLNMAEIQSFQLSNNLSLSREKIVDFFNELKPNTVINISKTKAGKPIFRTSAFRKSNYIQNRKSLSSFSLQAGVGIRGAALQREAIEGQTPASFKSSISLLGDFYVIGDQICDSPTETEQVAVQVSGQIIHYNNKKITLRRAQPIFISPKGILHKFDGEFIDPKAPVITLSYQRLKTGDIIQGIPKVEQFFEARTTKRGRLFRDSLPSLLKALFKRYQSKMSQEQAVRQSFYKIQQIIVDGVHRVYKSQGVTISDKHLEVIVKQMTSKVRILDGAQTGFFPGEVVDLSFVEKINQFLIKKITYEPLVLGITKASLEVDSFLSAASFQQTTRVLSQAAIYRKKDFLKGLKENVILGNLIPAGTGYLVYLDDVSSGK